jgi:small-conductance mechanosensitive channel
VANQNLYEILNSIGTWFTYDLFTIGKRTISLQSVFIFLLIILGSWLASRYLRKLFDRRFSERFDGGTGHTLRRLLHYIIITIGVMLAIDFIGIDLTSLAVVASFLSVGIGFGLRNVASNFISGIILMVERPISVGDFISVDDFLGTVQTIGLRATVFRTVDNQSIVIPNSTFLEQNVINWTRGEEKIRLRFSVGVAYGSDVEKVKSVLLEAAEEHDDILKDPEPKVVFQEFGDSSLNFELRIWVSHARERVSVRDELNTLINNLFAENELEMPFPQRDLHLRSSTPISIEETTDTSEE